VASVAPRYHYELLLEAFAPGLGNSAATSLSEFVGQVLLVFSVVLEGIFADLFVSFECRDLMMRRGHRRTPSAGNCADIWPTHRSLARPCLEKECKMY